MAKELKMEAITDSKKDLYHNLKILFKGMVEDSQSKWKWEGRKEEVDRLLAMTLNLKQVEKTNLSLRDRVSFYETKNLKLTT